VTSRPIKALQVTHALGVGGAETWLLELLRLWSKSGEAQMDFLLTSGRRGIFDDEAAKLGARLFYCRYGRNRLSQFVPEFRSILRQGDYDAVHDHQDYVSGWHFLAGWGLLPRVTVSHVHNPLMHITTNYAVSPARRLSTAIGRRLLNRLATNVCGTSAAILRQYGFEPGRTHRPDVSVAHCGFEVRRYSGPREQDRVGFLEQFGWRQDAIIVLFAGRLDQAMEFDHPKNHKNSWFALNVVKLAAEQDARVCLIMAGAGDDMRRKLEEAVAAWGLSDRLRLVGVRQDVPQLMRAADVLLFPSKQEGLGMVAVEAQAAGLPVLASTAVPRECVVLPQLCEFLPLSRSLEDWAENLLQISTRPRLSEEKCGAAVQASRFSIENSAARISSIYAGRKDCSVHPNAVNV
jgi:glycosyltransferase involved in cell wall biosynthesis